jgi:hypothetical protein
VEEKELSVEQIAGHLQAALTEVRACLPGKPRTVSVGGCEYTAGDVRGFLKRMKQAERACEIAYKWFDSHGVVYPEDDDRLAGQENAFAHLKGAMKRGAE